MALHKHIKSTRGKFQGLLKQAGPGKSMIHYVQYKSCQWKQKYSLLLKV